MMLMPRRAINTADAVATEYLQNSHYRFYCHLTALISKVRLFSLCSFLIDSPTSWRSVCCCSLLSPPRAQSTNHWFFKLDRIHIGREILYLFLFIMTAEQRTANSVRRLSYGPTGMQIEIIPADNATSPCPSRSLARSRLRCVQPPDSNPGMRGILTNQS